MGSNPWGHKESCTTEQLTHLISTEMQFKCFLLPKVLSHGTKLAKAPGVLPLEINQLGGTSVVLGWLRICFPTQVLQFTSLVGELGSHKSRVS